MTKVIYCNKTVRTNDDIEALKDSVAMSGISEAMVLGWICAGNDRTCGSIARYFRFCIKHIWISE